jgi:DNA polymerase/3'-5' exonuclease PolX
MNRSKRPYAQVKAIADELVSRLAEACQRIELAGSLRRQSAEVGDIEIVATAKGDEVDRLLSGWPVTLVKNGPKYKQFLFTTKNGEPYQADLFLQPDPATWGVNFTIRTGSADFSRWLVSPVPQGGGMPAGYQSKGGRIWQGDNTLDTPNEANVFDVLGIGWVEPQARDKGLWSRVLGIQRRLGQIHLEPGWSLRRRDKFLAEFGVSDWQACTVRQLFEIEMMIANGANQNDHTKPD